MVRRSAMRRVTTTRQYLPRVGTAAKAKRLRGGTPGGGLGIGLNQSELLADQQYIRANRKRRLGRTANRGPELEIVCRCLWSGGIRGRSETESARLPKVGRVPSRQPQARRPLATRAAVRTVSPLPITSQLIAKRSPDWSVDMFSPVCEHSGARLRDAG